MEYNELYHHGTKGMSWGKRLYQYKDGSLTPLGRLRYGNKTNMRAAEKAKAKKIADKKAKKESSDASKKENKPISEMTDEELQKYINRMTIEKQAYNLQKEVAAFNPQKVSAGKKFVNDLWDKTIHPALSDAGKNLMSDYLKKVGKKYLGLDEEKEKSLKELAEESTYKKTIALNNDFLENRKKKKEAEKRAEKEAKNKSNKEEKTNNNSRSSESNGSDSGNETYTGTVYGEGTSRRSTSSNSRRSDSRQTDTYWTYATDIGKSSTRSSGESYTNSYKSSANDISESTRKLGRSYIAGLLPAPKDDDK